MSIGQRELTKDIFRHIDEIMTFLPYGKEENGLQKFKVWIYDIYDIEEIFEDDYSPRIYKHIVEMFPILKREHINNLNIISNALFGSSFDNNKESFFIIPIDTKLPPYIFPKNPPIFNSTYIETRDESLEPQLLLSTNGKISEKIKAELSELKSCITNRPIKYHIINTDKSGLHITNSTLPGGNLHCVIKQEMEIP
jgi:hypothetical protein